MMFGHEIRSTYLALKPYIKEKSVLYSSYYSGMTDSYYPENIKSAVLTMSNIKIADQTYIELITINIKRKNFSQKNLQW